MKILDSILSYLFFMGVSFMGGWVLGVVERPYALTKLFDYCIAK